jgi:DNA-binding response OmpR family regulator
MVPTVLIIDDEAGIRFALRRFFERLRWTVQEAADGEEGLAQIRATSDEGDDQLDLVICDVNLPKRSGSAVLSQLKAERPAIVPRIVLSTGDDVLDVRAGSELQTHPNVLQKPFDLATLKAMVHAVTGLA